MGDFSHATSATLVVRTYPFMLLRAAVYFGIAAAFIVAAGGGAGIGSSIGLLAGSSGRIPGAFWGAAAGIAAIALIVWWLREYLLYFIEAAHIAAMTHALAGETSERRPDEVGYFVDLVQRRFRDMNTLFQLERLVHGALDEIAETTEGGGLQARGSLYLPAGLANTGFKLALGSLAEVILARTLRGSAGNIWAEARDALILFAQIRRELTQDALSLVAVTHGAGLIVFLMALLPAAKLAAGYPGASTAIAILFAASFAWCFKRALIDPLATASMLQLCFRSMEDRRVDAAWDVRLTETSEHYREIKARAATFVRGPRRSFVA